MKNKILGILLAILLVCSVFMLTACGDGEQGPQGEQGEQGEPGKDGANGKDGIDGVGIVSIEKISTEGLVDTYEITYTNGTKTTFTITNGANGADGEDGKDGEKGETGEQGPVGPQGPQGEQGEKGETGEQGPVGPQGPQGEQGEKGEILTACEHEFGEWTVIYTPTCESIGVNSRICIKCNSIEYKFIENSGHEFAFVMDLVNTCEEHWAIERCNICNLSRVVEKEIEHELSEWKTTPASCTTDGYNKRECSKCDYSEIITLTASGHTEVTDAALAPTCTVAGLTEGSHCSVCNEILTEQVSVPKLGHTYENDVCINCGGSPIAATPEEYFYFELLEDGTYSVSCPDYENMPSTVVIPSTYNGAPVTVVYDFVGCEDITEVIICDGITVIYCDAFYGCTNLKSVSIPDSVKYILDYAFEDCYSLTDISFPEELLYLGSDVLCETAYYYDESNWKNDALYVGNHLLYVNSDFAGHFEILPGTTTIGGYAFEFCELLESIYIPNSVTFIGDSTFSNCDSLTSIIIPDSVKYIGEYAFAGCDSLQSVTLSKSIEKIYDHTFYECTSLVSITIPRSVTYIGGTAFWGCDGTLLEAIFEDTGGWERNGVEITTEEFSNYSYIAFLLTDGYSNKEYNEWIKK